MKKNIILIFIIITSLIRAQLPPAAQALYNEFYNSHTSYANAVLSQGTQTSATADGNSFYLKWMPANATPSNTPLIFLLHGSSSNAFVVMSFWLPRAQLKGVGIIAVQWYRGAASVSPNDYFDDNSLYTYIDTALKRVKYPSNKAMLSGFSRGSARSYAIQFKDVQPTGKNYFCTILSDAGKPDSAYPLYSQINSGMYGHTFCAGKQWAMFCGGQDPNPARDGCPAMNSAKTNWVAANGGNVGLFIQAPTLGHTGLTDTPAYMDSVIKFYLKCYNNTSIIKHDYQYEFRIYPNPSNDFFNIETALDRKRKISIINNLGQLVKEVWIEGIENTINVRELPAGVYFIVSNGISQKLIKT